MYGNNMYYTYPLHNNTIYMKNKVKAFKDDWYSGEEPQLLRHRLNILVKDGVTKGNEEVDIMLDRLSAIRRELLKFYDLKETDL